MSEQEKLITEQNETAAYVPPVRKKKRVRYAAPLGFLVLLFACIGVVSVISGLIGFIVRRSDDTPLKEELYDFLNPVMQFCPSNFEDEAKSEQEALLLASVYRITEAERIRQLREKDDSCIYELDDTGWRIQIPQEVIENSFSYLFGDVTPAHKTVGEIEYNAETKTYHVPLSINTSGYTPVIGTVKKSGNTYTVRVAYVANADIEVDEKGHSIAPTFDMGKYSQIYTVERNEDDSLVLMSVSTDGQSVA